jgi:negative regulator of flagellin synthesis FlgM
MSISQINSQSMNLRAVAALRANAASANTPASAPVARQADSISLSDTARAMSTARSSVAGAADVREDRIAALKADIANGSYSVDSRSLAQDMLSAGALG